MRSVLCIIAFVIFGNLIHYAKAEGGSDAPPYRIDSEGNKVVDYIAELESNVDNLTRQVHGLESQLEEKENLLRDTKSGIDKGITEKDLVKQENRNCELEVNCPPDNTLELERLQVELKTANNELDRLKEQISANIRLEREKEEKDKAEKSLYQDAAESKNNNILALQKTISDLENARKELELDLEERHRNLNQLKEELAKIDNEESLIESEYNKRKETLELLRVKNESVWKRIERERETSDNRKYSVFPEVRAQGQAQTTRASMSNLRLQAIEGLRGSISTEINGLQRLISTRDSLFSNYLKENSGSALKVNPSKLVSQNNRGLIELGEAISKTTSTQELSQIQSEVNQIKRKIIEDIALVKRLGKK